MEIGASQKGAVQPGLFASSSKLSRKPAADISFPGQGQDEQLSAIQAPPPLQASLESEAALVVGGLRADWGSWRG